MEGNSKYNPFEGVNLAFVFHNSQTTGATDVVVTPEIMGNAQKVFRTKKPFIVHMYDWDLDKLSIDDVHMVFDAIHNSFVTHQFSDPLKGKTNQAAYKTLTARVL